MSSIRRRYAAATGNSTSFPASLPAATIPASELRACCSTVPATRSASSAMGVALEPEADYELSENGGGCEDPRISFVEPLQHYVMTYTALSRRGPRIAIAVSDDLLHWRRVGLATFHPFEGIAFDSVDNKDASFFPLLIPDPLGHPAVALVHRPLFPGTRPEEKVRRSKRHSRYPKGKHLDLVLPPERERRSETPRRVRRTSPIGRAAWRTGSVSRSAVARHPSCVVMDG